MSHAIVFVLFFGFYSAVLALAYAESKRAERWSKRVIEAVKKIPPESFLYRAPHGHE